MRGQQTELGDLGWVFDQQFEDQAESWLKLTEYEGILIGQGYGGQRKDESSRISSASVPAFLVPTDMAHGAARTQCIWVWHNRICRGGCTRAPVHSTGSISDVLLMQLRCSPRSCHKLKTETTSSLESLSRENPSTTHHPPLPSKYNFLMSRSQLFTQNVGFLALPDWSLFLNIFLHTFVCLLAYLSFWYCATK